MRTNLKILITFFFIAFISSAQTNESEITIEKLFHSGEFRSEYFGPARWLHEGNSYTTIEASKSGLRGQEIVKYDVLTGNREVLVSAEMLLPEGKERPIRIANYSWSPNNKMLMIFTNTRRVWRRNTRGDYWVLNLENGKLFQLGKNLPSSSLMFAKFSPDNKKAAYVSKNNLYIESLEDHKVRQITSDGSETIINGTFDWVYEEELGLRDGFRWSPDSKKIAFWQLDASGVGEFYMINNTDSIYSKIIPVQYPKVGTTNSAAKVAVFNTETSKTVWMDVPGNPRNNYIAKMDWATNSEQIYIQHLNRTQDNLDIMLGDIENGKMQTIYNESSDTWINMHSDMKWFDNGDYFTWVSDKDGWRHIYKISRDGEEVTIITKGDFDVINIEYIDIDNGWIYYIASPDDPSQRYLYRVKLEGNGKVELITKENYEGTNSYSISPNSKFAIHSYSNFNTPKITQLISLPDHESIRYLVKNERLKEKVEKLNIKDGEFFRITTETGIELDGWRILPPDFDPSKKYPVLFYVYSEPGSQTVLDSFSWFYLWHQMLAQKGYIVMSIDSRGTPAPRGREWRKCVHKKIGIIAVEDQANAVKRISEKWDYVDSERIAIWGWSGGGSMTLNMMFRHPELYNTGMSVAPVSNQLYYDTIYQERYMGLPSDNLDNYKKGSPITYASGLEGNLLLVHGTGDDNVHYQNSEAVINELIKHNKQFTMFAYPNRSHSIYEGQNTRRHLFTLLTNYLTENMKPGGIEK